MPKGKNLRSGDPGVCMTPVDVVLIGRNEGARLVAALASVQGQARRIVYVDSGSVDGSAAAATRAGAEVVLLDASAPFTAARARNAGFARLVEGGPAPEYVQFIDGDCLLVDGWIAKGAAHLDQTPDTAMVTGWRSEIHRDASLYNQLCDWEWHRPAGRDPGLRWRHDGARVGLCRSGRL